MKSHDQKNPQSLVEIIKSMPKRVKATAQPMVKAPAKQPAQPAALAPNPNSAAAKQAEIDHKKAMERMREDQKKRDATRDNELRKSTLRLQYSHNPHILQRLQTIKTNQSSQNFNHSAQMLTMNSNCRKK